MSKVNTKDVASTLEIGKKKSGAKKYIFIGLGVLVLFIIILMLRGGKSDLPKYTTVDVEKGDITVQVSATGTLQPTNEVEVGTELSGTIKSVYVDYNSHVKKGQLLAKIDTEKLESQIAQYRAAVAAAEANVLQAQAAERETLLKLNQYKNLWALTDKKSPSQQDMDSAEADYAKAAANSASAKASVTQAKASLKTMETDLAKSEIRSPVNGVVLDRGVDAGQTVAASYSTPELFKIAEDLTKMELQVDVDEADIGQVKEGQTATFTVDAYPDKVFKGVITQARFGSETVDNVVTYKTVIRVDNSDMLLRPGMTATADIIIKEIKDAIKIPAAAVRYSPPAATEQKQSFVSKLMPRPPRREKAAKKVTNSPDDATVWVLRADGMADPVDIKVGESDGTFKQVTKGKLKPGDKLITAQDTGK